MGIRANPREESVVSDQVWVLRRKSTGQPQEVRVTDAGALELEDGLSFSLGGSGGGEVTQDTAADLKMEPTQTDPTKMQVEPVQDTAADNQMEPVQLIHDELNLNANAQVGNADVTRANPVPTDPVGLAADTGNVDEPAADTAALVTIASAPGVQHVLGQIIWSYSGGDPVGGNITVEDGSGNTVIAFDITKEGPGFMPFTPPLVGTVNTDLIVTLADPGASVTGKLSLHTAPRS